MRSRSRLVPAMLGGLLVSSAAVAQTLVCTTTTRTTTTTEYYANGVTITYETTETLRVCRPMAT
jgi:hypothetical protein